MRELLLKSERCGFCGEEKDETICLGCHEWMIHKKDSSSEDHRCKNCLKKTVDNSKLFARITSMKLILNGLMIMVLLTSNTLAKEPVPNFNRLADAIYKAEGGTKTKFPYGIKSVSCKDAKECREICLKTIRNAFKRYKNEKLKISFLEYLRNKYAPLIDSELNKNWLPNVIHFYGEEI